MREHASELRDRDGALVENWYVACRSEELTSRKPLGRMIYDTPLALFARESPDAREELQVLFGCQAFVEPRMLEERPGAGADLVAAPGAVEAQDSRRAARRRE